MIKKTKFHKIFNIDYFATEYINTSEKDINRMYDDCFR